MQNTNSQSSDNLQEVKKTTLKNSKIHLIFRQLFKKNLEIQEHNELKWNYTDGKSKCNLQKKSDHPQKYYSTN